MAEGGQITNRDLYEAQRATEQQLGGLALQVATLVAEWRGVGDRLDSGSDRMKDFEKRLRVLEAFRWMLMGGSAIGGFAAGGIGAWVVYVLEHH